MSWFDSIGSWIGDNSGWLEPLVKAGVGAIGQSQSQDTQSQYLDYLKQREQQNYQSSVDQINAYNAQLAASGSRGSGSGAASAAAARATEANRMKASKKANKVTQETYKKILEMYAPLRETADTLLPQMSQTYQNSLGMQGALASYLNSPAQVAKLDAAVPAWQVNVPLPDSVRLR